MYPHLSLRQYRTSCPQKLSFSFAAHVSIWCRSYCLTVFPEHSGLPKKTSPVTLVSLFKDSDGDPVMLLQLHELRWGLRASALCTHWDRHTHGATHIYRSAFYKSVDHHAFSRDCCLNSSLCCLLATWLWARCLSLLFAPPLASVLSPIKGNNTAHLTLLLWGLTELTSVQCSDGHLVPGKDWTFVNAFKELASLLMPYTHT